MALSSFAIHCSIGLTIRLLLIIYSNYHDRKFSVPYTDIDYHVYTDASRLIINNNSPYDRHTYRYTPLLAVLMIPNILIHENFGKIFFSIVDIVVTIMIKKIITIDSFARKKANICALAWLYNPLTIVITTRGNADSLAVMLVISTLYHLHRDEPILSGIFHGISIHLRLYPIAFSLSMYLSIREKNSLLPNIKQFKLVVACLSSLFALTAVSYHFYGYRYIYESMIYHLVRKDARHNFSVFFYLTYLSTVQKAFMINRILMILPQFVVLVGISLRYSNKRQLSFAMFAQSMIMVTYNTVMTSQYFIWFLSLLPLCLPYLRMSRKRFITLTIIWFLSQGVWLYHAYILEFNSVNAFNRIWLDGILFFLVNIMILRDMINHYDSGIAIKTN